MLCCITGFSFPVRGDWNRFQTLTSVFVFLRGTKVWGTKPNSRFIFSICWWELLTECQRQAAEAKLTFLVSAEEVQLFLLLPPQRVDYCNGQPECFLGVTVWSQSIYPGTRSRDVLCGRRGRNRKDVSILPSIYLVNLPPPRPPCHMSPSGCSSSSHHATGATLGHQRGSCHGCHGNSSWCSGLRWWCAAGGGPASAGHKPQLPLWILSGEAESVRLEEMNIVVRQLWYIQQVYTHIQYVRINICLYITVCVYVCIGGFSPHSSKVCQKPLINQQSHCYYPQQVTISLKTLLLLPTNGNVNVSILSNLAEHTQK